MLNCAPSAALPPQVEGAVTFNGAKLTKRLKRQVGYVLQASAGR